MGDSFEFGVDLLLLLLVVVVLAANSVVSIAADAAQATRENL